MKSMAVNAINKKLTMDEIVAQAWVFFLAGSETTSNTLGYGSYELALNPHIQDRLYDEVMSSVDSEGEISYDELAKLPLLDAVISETLRLYPSVVRLDRKAKVDYKLADTGITIEKGKCVEIPVYAIHHSEEYYENAHQFDPDRFMPQNRHKLVAYTYLPFGAGPHNCIGMRFALMEVKLAFVHIIQRFRFVRTEQTSVPLEYRKAVPFLSATSVVVGIQKR
ncbi:unnamed protein product [Medioppia subpectinata]|uniref:Cytochrome P450 n=1 Tax=Medioppia subpectinata TaxID=1979941 RepID=A0A7R9Q6M7_9ACAR|nr:unnamed protein product [Medioppia subpectinata]CAG2113397.1 unnamed protein product [Medioppia subpectinata]